MNHAVEKEYVAIASRIIVRAGNCPRAFSRKTRKELITDHSNILQNWYQNVKYRKFRPTIYCYISRYTRGDYMHNKVILLRISYWFGAVIDGLMVIPMLCPGIAGIMFGIDNFNPGNDYKYAMMVGASLMFGWTVLLIWADRKPVERKGVIIITVIPVLIGLILAGAFAVSSGLIKIEKMIPTWIIQSVLLILFCYSYYVNSMENK
jgi:hypothetical protein